MCFHVVICMHMHMHILLFSWLIWHCHFYSSTWSNITISSSLIYRAGVFIHLLPSVVDWGLLLGIGRLRHLLLRGRESLTSFRERPSWVTFGHWQLEVSRQPGCIHWWGPSDVCHHTLPYFLLAKWPWCSPLISWGSFFSYGQNGTVPTLPGFIGWIMPSKINMLNS